MLASSCLSEHQNLSIKMLSTQHPRISILMALLRTDGALTCYNLVGKFLAGELEALIAVEDFPALPPQSSLQRLEAEVRFHG